MEIDRLLSKLMQKSNPALSHEEVKKGFKVEFSKGKEGSPLIVALPNWHAKIPPILIYLHSRQNGYSHLAYTVPPEMLSDEPTTTVKNLEWVTEKVLDSVDHYSRSHDSSSVHFIGLSIGGVIAIKAANQYASTSSLSMVPSGDCLADALWNGLLTQNKRQGYEKQGVTLDSLKTEWKGLDPVNNFDNLINTPVFLYLDESDLTVPYKNGCNLVKAMETNGLLPIVTETAHLGHFGLMLKFCLWDNPTKGHIEGYSAELGLKISSSNHLAPLIPKAYTPNSQSPLGIYQK